MEWKAADADGSVEEEIEDPGQEEWRDYSVGRWNDSEESVNIYIPTVGSTQVTYTEKCLLSSLQCIRFLVSFVRKFGLRILKI